MPRVAIPSSRDISRALAKLRVRLGDRLHRAVTSPQVARINVHVIRSIEEHLFREEIAAHVIGWTPWREALVEHYDLPANLGAGFRRVMTFGERRIWELRDVVMTPDRGLAWFADGAVLEESVGSLNRMTDWDDMRFELLRRPRRLQTGRPVAAIGGPPFYHWLTEILPGVVGAARQREDLDVVVSPRSPRYVLAGARWLRDLGVLQRDPLVHDGPVAVETAVVPAMPAASGATHPQDAEALRELIGPTLPAAGGERLYISRRAAAKRPLAGEAALERALSARGYRVVRLEEHSLAAQAGLLRSAGDVVAPHGAGLAHLIWCDAGTRVCEIFPHGFVNDCYARLAVGQGLDYQALWADPDGDIDVSALLEQLGD